MKVKSRAGPGMERQGAKGNGRCLPVQALAASHHLGQNQFKDSNLFVLGITTKASKFQRGRAQKLRTREQRKIPSLYYWHSTYMWYGSNKGKMRNAELATAIASRKMSTHGWMDRADTTRTRRNLKQKFPQIKELSTSQVKIH